MKPTIAVPMILLMSIYVAGMLYLVANGHETFAGWMLVVLVFFPMDLFR